jgi:hypothetical protein
MTTATIQIVVRRGLAAQWTAADTLLDQGEMGLETDTGKYKWGDGTTLWTSLTYDVTFGATVTAVTFVGDVTGDVTGDLNGILGGTTPAAATVTEFTSNGIDDNATSAQLSINDAGASITGSFTAGGGVDKLSTATGAVDVSASADPAVGEVLVATSTTTATWQVADYAASLKTVKVTTTTYTAAGKTVILVDDDTAGSGVAVTLPAAVDGLRYHIKKLGTTGNITVAGYVSPAVDMHTYELPMSSSDNSKRPEPQSSMMRQDKHWSTDALSMYIPGCDTKPFDYTQYKKTVTIGGTPTPKAKGAHGGMAYDFGIHTDDYYYQTDLVHPLLYNNMSFGCRVTPNSVTAQVLTLMSHARNQTSNHRLSLQIAADGKFDAWDWWTGSLKGTTVAADGQTYHVFVTHNGTTAEKKLYVNGVLEATKTGATNNHNVRVHMLLGSEDLSRAESMGGQMDEFRFYDRTLEAKEIALLAKYPNISLVSKESAYGQIPGAPAGSPESIDGAASEVISVQYNSINAVSDGTEWYLI